MNVRFVPVQSRSNHPLTYACWLQVGKVLVKEVGPTNGYAYWRALTAAYLAVKGVQL